MDKLDFKQEVAKRLAAAPESAAKQEMIEELSENLFAKYQDLINSGASESAAYAQALDEFGDERELISYLKSTGTHRGFIEFQSIDTNTYETALPAERLHSADVKVSNIDISVSFHDEPDAKLIFHGDMSDIKINEDANGCLRIWQKETIIRKSHFLRNMKKRSMQLILPHRRWKSLSFATASGSIKISDLPAADTLNIKAVSGTISVKGCADSAFAQTVSGQIYIYIESKFVDAQSASGQIRIFSGAKFVDAKNASGQTFIYGEPKFITAQSASGRICIFGKVLPEKLEVGSASGDCKIALPDTDGFSITVHSASGKLKSDIPLTHSAGVMKYLDGGDRMFNVHTASGNIDISKFAE